MRWVRPQSFLSREAGHEQQWRAHGSATLFARVSFFWLAVTRHLSAVSVWSRRFGIARLLMDWSSPRCRPSVVAGATAGSDWLRKLALSIHVVICRQCAADQPRLSHLGRALTGERCSVLLLGGHG